jgi:siroheme synthase-like protein
LSKAVMDNIDRQLLGLLQTQFPLVREPFQALGLKLGLSGEAVIRQIQNLKDAGLIRQIGPIFDSRRLGYQSTLAGMKVPPNRLEKAAETIYTHPGISHAYLRNHEVNLWITLAVPPNLDIEEELTTLGVALEAEKVISLPVVKFFKLRAVFGVDDGEEPAVGAPSTPAELSEIDREIINTIQEDLPLIARPFDEYAQVLDMGLEDFLAGCRSLLERGLLRRFGAAVNHRRAGYGANAMVCWQVPAEKVDLMGNRLAALKAVSHCYERKTSPLWRHNIFAMIHGLTEAECRQIAAQVAGETGLADFIMLFSTREIKKQRVRYTVHATTDLATAGRNTLPHYYPVFLNVKGQKCMVIGGGEVAVRKVKGLLASGAAVRVISPDASPEITTLAEKRQIRLSRHPYRPGDLKGVLLVIAATNDPEVNAAVSQDARAAGVAVNVVDDAAKSSFILPSTLQRGDVTIAISTSGRSPALARKLRTRLEQEFGEEYALLALIVNAVREEVKQRGLNLNGDDWQEALDLDQLLGLIKEGRLEEAKKALMDRLITSDPNITRNVSL